MTAIFGFRRCAPGGGGVGEKILSRIHCKMVYSQKTGLAMFQRLSERVQTAEMKIRSSGDAQDRSHELKSTKCKRHQAGPRAKSPKS